ncbi:MAG TPA: hypothetical protein DHO02_02860 [Syntrophaceae bacterium]|jgi:hypothetical protein|nr:hypothetical protein [Syntrophaceae bacterium]
MTKQQIKKYLKMLNDQLAGMGIKGEICLYGGAMMCIVFNARPATKDIDAVFKPEQKIHLAALRIAKENQLPPDWLNDGVKAYLSKKHHKDKILFNWPNLAVYHADAEYLLAMKAISARHKQDIDDIKFLLQELRLKDAASVLEIIQKYYPKNMIKPATKLLIEEFFK